MIPQDTISEIIETARIDEVVEDFVALKKRGANLLGLCPFHDEKTPSFTVSPAKGIYKCFGCGKAGNSVGFIMEHEQYNYPEALKYLAKKYNIEIQETFQSEEQLAIADEKESLYIVSEFASNFFKKSLNETDEGRNIGLSYFKERGFTTKIIEKFDLGYSPDVWDAFTKEALDNGYKEEFLTKTGLTIAKEDGKKFDRFKGRVMFPIQNVSGRVIGFGGRTLKKEAKVAKYLNSPESDIYHKSKVLYGLYQSKKDIAQLDNCLLVEGYTDVISFHQSGLGNVVSSSGTSLTGDQIRLIKRYTKNITILFDGDVAGIKASFRGIDMILQEGMNVKVVLFPDGEDPDSYARKLSKEELESFIHANAKDFIRFKTMVLKEEVANDPIKKADLIRETINSISLIPDAISRSVYIKECSDLIDVDEMVLIQELNKVRRKKIQKEQQEIATRPYEDNLPQASPKQVEQSKDENLDFKERDILRMMIKNGSGLVKLELENEENEIETQEIRLDHFIIMELQDDNINFEDEMNKKLFTEYINILGRGIEPDESFFIHHDDPEISAVSIDIISSKYHLDNWEGKNIYTELEEDKLLKSAEKYLYYYKLSKVKSLLHANMRKLQEGVSEEQASALLKRQVGLESAKKEIASRLGNVTL